MFSYVKIVYKENKILYIYWNSLFKLSNLAYAVKFLILNLYNLRFFYFYYYYLVLSHLN